MIGSPQDLEYFMEVTRTLNLTRAAERLGVTQPTLSLAVRRLEDSLGAQLLIRGKTGVRLTRAGSHVESRARQLILDWIRLRDAALEVETGVGGRFTLGCYPSLGIDVLPRFFGTLLSSHPALEVHLVHGLSREVTEDVISRKVDFALSVNPVRHPELILYKLRDDYVSLWRSPKYKTSDVLLCDNALGLTHTLRKELDKRDILFQRTINCPNLEVIAHLASSCVGVGILPESIARRFGPAKLVQFTPTIGPYRDQIYLVYRADIEKNASTKAIISAIKSASA